MKQNRLRVRIDLADAIGGPDAWGTEFGATIFSRINLTLLALGEGTLVELDFGGLRRCDVSFQREAVVETLRKHRPRLLFVADNLADVDLRENLELALERRGEALIVRTSSGRTVLGRKLTPEHQETLQQAWKEGELTSAALGSDKLKISTASSRLSWLWKAGLVERVEGSSATGGREHRYVAFL